jgi:hypothetical protein
MTWNWQPPLSRDAQLIALTEALKDLLLSSRGNAPSD